MIKYRSYQSERVRKPSPAGNIVAPIFKEQLVEEKAADGSTIHRTRLVQVGETNIPDKINACKDDVNVYKILDRYARGDLLALKRRGELLYADLTKQPRNIHEAVKLVHKAQNEFESLPPEIREAFGNDPEAFLDAAQDKEKFAQPFIDFYKKHGLVKDVKKEDKAE